jgi:hypothetical protein
MGFLKEAELRTIDSFRGHYRFLSNFYMPSPLFYEGVFYLSSEHAFQASKTEDKEIRRMISKLETPAEAKEIGGKLKLRKNWDQIRERVMYEIVFRKFAISYDLQMELTGTYPHYLIEGNNWGDKLWGCVWQQGRWEGENTLGKLLMKIREEIRVVVSYRG